MDFETQGTTLEALLGREKAETLAHLRKESMDIYNRIHSITEDVVFVRRVRAAYPNIPLLPNLRCGAWYSDPKICLDVPVYFKSTDGHYGNWSFNLRRPNVHLLHTLVEYGGALLVDSTRSGKRLPDALSKTIPIWCAVINRAILVRFPSERNPLGWDTQLYTAPGAVSPQEHHQIESFLDVWALALAQSTYDIPKLDFPLRPIWITPSASQWPPLSPSKDGGYTLQNCSEQFTPLVCVSASKQIHEGVERRAGGFAYIQGSGDDHELWGMGLTPKIFWDNENALLSSDRAELPDRVAFLVKQSLVDPVASGYQSKEWTTPPTPVAALQGCLMICLITDLPSALPTTLPEEPDPVAYLLIGEHMVDDEPETLADNTEHTLPSVSRMRLSEGKRGQARFLQSILPRSMKFIESRLSAGDRVCVACDTGKDVSVGVVLAALQMFFSGDREFRGEVGLRDKDTIRTRLQWIISSRPSANPSRTTLKRVNEFLLSPPRD